MASCNRGSGADVPAVEGDTDTDTDADTDTDTDTDADADTDADTDSDAPCADGTWAGWDSPDGVVWVSWRGDDSDDGNIRRPLKTFAAAAQATRGVSDARIGLLPGTLAGDVQLKSPDGGSITVSGCSADETILVRQVYRKRPVVSVIGPGTFTLRRVRTEGGGSGITVVAGATALLEDVEVVAGSGRGISVVGEDTWATLRRVTVSETLSAAGLRPAGWGVATRMATVVLEDVTISDNTGFGLFLDRGTVSASNLTIQQTAQTGKLRHGVGVYANQLDSLSLTDCVITDSEGGGIFSIDNHQVDIRGCVVTGVGANESAPGDGIVIRRVGAWKGDQMAALSDNTVSGAARLGIAVGGDILLVLDGNVAGATNGVVVDGSSIFADEHVSVGTSSTQQADPLDLATYPLGRLFVGEAGPERTGNYP